MEKHIKLCFTNTPEKYGIAIPRHVAAHCPLINIMINSGMKETTRAAEGRSIKISEKTTIPAVQTYFRWLTRSIQVVRMRDEDLLPSMIVTQNGVAIKNPTEITDGFDAAILAQFLQDEMFLDCFTPNVPLRELDRPLETLPMQVSMFYVNAYLNECFDLSRRSIFIGKLQAFIEMNPSVARFIWDNCPRSDLIDGIEAPRRRRGPLMKKTFDEIPGYITMLKQRDNINADAELESKIAYYIDNIRAIQYFADSDDQLITINGIRRRVAEFKNKKKREIHKTAQKPIMSTQLVKGLYGK